MAPAIPLPIAGLPAVDIPLFAESDDVGPGGLSPDLVALVIAFPVLLLLASTLFVYILRRPRHGGISILQTIFASSPVPASVSKPLLVGGTPSDAWSAPSTPRHESDSFSVRRRANVAVLRLMSHALPENRIAAGSRHRFKRRAARARARLRRIRLFPPALDVPRRASATAAQQQIQYHVPRRRRPVRAYLAGAPLPLFMSTSPDLARASPSARSISARRRARARSRTCPASASSARPARSRTSPRDSRASRA
jgi:hypothetical protein